MEVGNALGGFLRQGYKSAQRLFFVTVLFYIFMRHSLRGHRHSIFEFFKGIWPLRGRGGPTQCRSKIRKPPNQKLHQVLRK